MTETLFRFTIPHVPVAKGRAKSSARVVGTKAFTRHYTPAKTRNFEALVKDFAAQAVGGAGADPLTCPVDLLVLFRFAIPVSWPKWKRELAGQGLVHHTKKPDCSNLVKAIEDACNGVLFKDDGQVVGVMVDKAYTYGPECIVVHGLRREGLACQEGREGLTRMAGYQADIRLEHLPLVERMRWRGVVPK